MLTLAEEEAAGQSRSLTLRRRPWRLGRRDLELVPSLNVWMNSSVVVWNDNVNARCNRLCSLSRRRRRRWRGTMIWLEELLLLLWR